MVTPVDQGMGVAMLSLKTLPSQRQTSTLSLNVKAFNLHNISANDNMITNP